MKAIFNSRIINTSEPLILSSNRAFCYGDGLFETIVTGKDRIDLIGAHLGRVERGCAVMGMELPGIISIEYIQECIETLVAENNIEGNVRTKLIVWRNEGGLYAPDNSSTSFLIEVKPSDKPFFRSAQKLGISEHYHTQLSPISFAKTLNALQYVMAGKQMKDNGWDEILLTDNKGNISETHIANIFWLMNDELYTPKLDTGCIDGIMRRTLIEKAKSVDISINEVIQTQEVLSNAESIFSTNASGLTWFKTFNGRELNNPEPKLAPIIKQLLRP